MYSEEWINKYGEDYIYNFLKNGGNIKLTSHNEDDITFSIAIENYLVKYRNSSDKVINYYLDSLFESFYNNPLFYAYSYILSNQLIVDSIINNNDKRKKLYEAGKKRLINGWKNTYEKFMNDEPVNINDKNKLIVLLIRGIRKGTKKNKELIDNFVYKLLQKNEVPNNDFEKLLIFNYASRYTLGKRYKMIDTFIKIGNLENEDKTTFRGGYEQNGFIVLNDHPSNYPFYKTLDEMIQCACHETTHAIQEQQAINDPYNVHAMEMAIQKLFAHSEYKTGDNYLFNEIEEDAQRNGYYNAGILYSMADRSDISMELIRKKNDYIKGRRFQYEYVTIMENGKKVIMSKEKYNVENIRKIVKNNPNLINKYPVLNNLFDKNGNHKTLEEMLKEDFKSHDIKNMYKDFIIYDIRHDGLNNIDLNNKDEEYKYNVLSKLCDTLDDFTDKANKIIRDYDYRKNNTNKTAFFYNVTIEDIIKLSDYIEPHLSWMRKYENRHPGNHNLYGTYTMALRNFFNTIDIYKSDDQLTNLEDITKKNIDKINSFDNNMKKEYMDLILEYFTVNERCTLLKINNKYMSLEKFIRTELIKHMSRDHYLYDNNKRLMLDKNGMGIKPHEFARNVLNKYKVTGLDDMFRDTISNNMKQSIAMQR